MRSYIERAKDFIHQVYPYIHECENPWDVRDQIHAFNDCNNRKVMVGNGLARIALITSDYVVKYDYDKSEAECIGGCENEMDIYYLAMREGVEQLFAPITQYYYESRYWYIMPRVRGIGSGGWYAEHYMTKQEKEFCRRHKITDLHSNNYGFVRGHVCLVDYACHLEEETEDSYDFYYNNRTPYEERKEA